MIFFSWALSQYSLYCWCLLKDPLFSALHLVYTTPTRWERSLTSYKYNQTQNYLVHLHGFEPEWLNCLVLLLE